MPPDFRLAEVDWLEEHEERALAPYAMKSRRSRGRSYPESPARFRGIYQRDRDRIVHSTAFRRLEYKTQVFVNHEGDHYRTRLTHTLEVAQVGRSLARTLRLNEDLVEAIALAHDLGHSPFGHSGESALDELMREHGGFNHNAQSLRVVDVLEKRYPDFDGLNLSWELRESTIKHGDHFGDEELPDGFRGTGSPLLEAQLADLADSLAYLSHDIDDGIRSGFIGLGDLAHARLWREASGEVRRAHGDLEERILVARAVSHLVGVQVVDLVDSTRDRLEARGIDSIERVRASSEPLVAYSDSMSELVEEMQQLLDARLYKHYRTLKMAEKAKRFLRAMFEEYLRNPAQLPPAHLERARRESVPRAICDYLAGMTDRYCQEEYQRLFHPFEKL